MMYNSVVLTWGRFDYRVSASCSLEMQIWRVELIAALSDREIVIVTVRLAERRPPTGDELEMSYPAVLWCLGEHSQHI